MSKESPDPTELVLRVLEHKAFYKNRFEAQVCALYPQIDSARAGRSASVKYLTSLMMSIPSAHVATAASIMARTLVDSVELCPPPAELRQIAAQSALQAMGMTFATLYERAQHFFALPPSDPAIAARYIERLMFTTVVHLTRERFALASDEQWQAAVIEVMFSTTINLAAMPVKAEQPPAHDISPHRPIPGKHG